jgi:aspartate aminotransferase-like enzyme
MIAIADLLDLPSYPPEGYARLADRLKALLFTRNDVVFVQAEAILALEATATSLGRPGLKALNVVTSPYGGFFGEWLRRAGTEVVTVTADAGRPIEVEAVRKALDADAAIGLVALVHAETSSGILNPLEQIAELTRARGALLVVDAVASVGGHALDVDALGIDVCVIGAQKALGGPAGLSMLSISPRAWAAMPPQPAPSSLALLDLKHNWLDRGRGALPGMPSALEFCALEAALDRVEAEGVFRLIARHATAAQETRSGLIALGIEPWIADSRQASTLVTAAPIPIGRDPDEFLAKVRQYGGIASHGLGEIRNQLIRLDHTGPNANRDQVRKTLGAYQRALAA